MELIINENDTASHEIEVDLAKFGYDEKSLFIEFAKILSYGTEHEEVEKIEVRSKLKIPMEHALFMFTRFVEVLVNHEDEFKSGYGLSMTESSEEDEK
jgi:hypothetical protein